jgi:hypothetical protein
MARDLVLHLLALLVYPGGLLVLAVGILAEAATGVVLGGAGPRGALVVPVRRLAPAAVPASALRLAVPLLAVLAATQLAAPLNPVSPVERNLLVAAVALAATMWLGWAPAWAPAGARLTLLVQVCWLVALLAPALLSETLRPQALGAVVVPAAMPLKVAAALLALVCLPVLLRLPATEDGPEGEAGLLSRPFLWLPLCGLFVSLALPPGPEDLGGAARFVVATLLVAGAAILLAALAARIPALGRLYPRLLPPLALVVLGLAAVTSSLT